KTFSYQPQNGDVVTATVSISGTGIACVTNSTATSTSVSMNVQPLQTSAVGLVSSSTSVCSGAGVSFTATGVNAGTAPSFAWKVNNQAAGNGANFTLIPSDGDVVSVILTVGTSVNGCYASPTITSDGITLAVTPNAIPAISIVPTAANICAGGNVTWVATSTQTGTLPAYSWYKNGVFQATGETFAHAPNVADQITAVVQVGGDLPTCLSATTASVSGTSISVTPIGQSACLLPETVSITGPSYVISNANAIVYSVPSVPGVTYQWTIPAGATIVAGDSTNSIVVDFGDNVNGTISVITTNSVGGVTASISVTTGVAPDITGITGPETVLPNQTGVVYSITTTAGNNYTWTLPTGATITSGLGTGTITVDFGESVNGTISVTESNPFGQASAFVTVTTAVPTAIATTLGELSIQAYPNPFTDGINILIQALGETEAKLTLTDLEGHRHENGLVVPLKSVVTLGQNLAAGVYILTVTCGESVVHQKVVKY
ncbi:MAG: T9SS type A sorting domain-containing protein, partial [Cytophagales bacterium]|nr:T9SS type A sorting domain-containing protein [Cytophagales bacterium]